MSNRRKIRTDGYFAVLKGESGVLSRVGSSVREDHVVRAVTSRSTEYYLTVLEDGDGVSEYEIYCSVDIAFSVELSEG